MRYRSGSLIIPNEDDEQSSSQRSLIATLTDVSVSEVRQLCTSVERCVSFSYRSDQTRFPSNNVTAYLFGHADWHVELTEDSPVSVVNTAFVDDIRYHTYVNTTREKTAVTREVGSLIKLLMKTEISEESVTSEEPPNNNSHKSRLRAGVETLQQTMSTQAKALPIRSSWSFKQYLILCTTKSCVYLLRRLLYLGRCLWAVLIQNLLK